MHKQYSAAFKAKIALEAIKNENTITEIASAYQIHPNMVAKWKKQVLENVSAVFETSSSKQTSDNEKKVETLSKIVGQQAIEIDWLKKKLL